MLSTQLKELLEVFTFLKVLEGSLKNNLNDGR